MKDKSFVAIILTNLYWTVFVIILIIDISNNHKIYDLNGNRLKLNEEDIQLLVKNYYVELDSTDSIKLSNKMYNNYTK